jgi:hypothetical protein
MIVRGEITSNPLWSDLEAIFRQPDTGDAIHLTGFVHTVKEDIPIFKILQEELLRNYAEHTAEFYTVTAYVAAGDYLHRVFPYRDNLEVSIKQTWVTRRGELDTRRPPVVWRYKALFPPDKNPRGSKDPLSSRQINDLNRLAPVTMVLELQDRCEEALRSKTISGVFQNVNAETLIRAATFHEANKVKVEGKPALEVIDIVEPDNTEAYPNLVLTSNLFVEDLPGWLQEKAKGVYNTGIGSFYQRWNDKPTWFVYPLYNDTRYNRAGKKLMVFDVPPERFQGHTSTYRVEGDITYVATTGDSGVLKTSNNRELAQGVGFRFADGESFMLKPVEITDTGVNTKRKELNYEYANRERADQNPYSPSYQSTANPYFMMSKNVAYQMVLHFVQWENGNPELIYPGMPCRFVYIDKGQREEVDGTVVFCYAVALLQGNPLEDKRHARTVQLGLMLQRRETPPETPPSSLVTGDET